MARAVSPRQRMPRCRIRTCGQPDDDCLPTRHKPLPRDEMTRTSSTLSAPSAATIAAVKAALFVICLIPAALLCRDAYNGVLGEDPIETIARASGEWTLRMLLFTLAMTPLRRIS
ncbi:MAG: hypothetical protein H6878_00005, partial [Rhodobiaceae bacterium]|nr:hypothetical protein [Rhodobiaceae bacterium]